MPEEPEEEEELSPYERVLLSGLSRTVDHMVQTEKIEVLEENLGGLVAELLIAAAEAETPKRMYRKLVRVLTHSDLVEEIYANDDELRDIFRSALEA